MDLNKMLDGITTVIFDMDGTLIDSMWIWRDIDEKFLADYGFDGLPEEYRKGLEGKNLRECAIFTKEFTKTELTVDEIIDIWENQANYYYENIIGLKKDVLEFLDELKKRKIKLGIATSSSRYMVEIVLKRLKIFDEFEVIVTSDEVQVGKPDPAIYLECAKQLQVNPSNCLVFEDTLAGIKSGINAGMKTCGVEDEMTHHIKEDKIRCADYFINDFGELM